LPFREAKAFIQILLDLLDNRYVLAYFLARGGGAFRFEYESNLIFKPFYQKKKINCLNEIF